MRALNRVLLWTGAATALIVLFIGALIVWLAPLLRIRPAWTESWSRPMSLFRRPAESNFCANAQCCWRGRRSEGSRYHIYVTNAAWRHRLFFFRSPKAGGLTYYVGHGGNAFLSGADFAAGRLVKWGHVTPPPRTLAYYCAHELSHIVVAEHLGVIASNNSPPGCMRAFGLCRDREPTVVRGAEECARRSADGRSDDAEIRRLSAISFARHVVLGQERLASPRASQDATHLRTGGGDDA